MKMTRTGFLALFLAALLMAGCASPISPEIPQIGTQVIAVDLAATPEVVEVQVI